VNALLEDPWEPEPIEVHVLHWPADESQRLLLAAEGSPRLLLVASGAEPPRLLDELEDWDRAGASTADVLARRDTLLARAAGRCREPVLDRDILRVGTRWVAIPSTRVPVVALLLARCGEVVRPGELAAAVAAGGGSSDAAAVRAVLHRLSKSFASVGLRLHSVRGRGLLLEQPS
jgi:hypothetical protein